MTTMKHVLTLLAATLLSSAFLSAQPQISPADSAAFADAQWTICELDRHAISKCASVPIFNSRQYISVITYKARKYNTSILQLEDGGVARTDSMAIKAGYTLAVNGSYFNVRTLYPSTHTRIGEETYGNMEKREFYRVNGILGFKDKKGRKPVISFCDSTNFRTVSEKWYSTLAAGPVLMLGGERINYVTKSSFYNSRHPRTLIGYDKKGNITMAVIDGRAYESKGLSIAETAIIAELLGLEAAINLDGGGSSTLWSAEDGVLNHPTDNKEFDHEGLRRIPNCIAAQKR